jgi:hypothetical protein
MSYEYISLYSQNWLLKLLHDYDLRLANEPREGCWEMTNIFGKPEKKAIRDALFATAVQALEEQGYKVERIARIGKSSVRLITKNRVSKKVSIRTTQDTWIAFPRNKANNGWATLEGVDFVVAASVDNPDDPRSAKIHMIPADEMRERFDRNYAARVDAGYQMDDGRGVWVSLYFQDAKDPVTHVGAGAGLKHRTIKEVPLTPGGTASPNTDDTEQEDGDLGASEAHIDAKPDEQPLTIAEAKRRLALSLGVGVDDIKITISS